MFYGSPDHRHKNQHAWKYQCFDSSNGYPVHAKTPEPMQFPEDELDQYGNPIINNNYREYAPEEPRRFHVVESKPAHAAKANKKEVEENVDAEAEEFIRYEHKKFLLSRMRSE